MKTAFYIARRYLISKKSVNVINLISGISVAGVTVGTFALVVILSVFNGLEFSIKSLFSSFDPDIKITDSLGRSFDPATAQPESLQKLGFVESVTPIVEGEAFLIYENRQYFVTLKGIPSDYVKIPADDSTFVVGGKFVLEDNNIPFAVVGQGVAYYLSVGLNFTEPIQIYTLNQQSRTNPTLNNVFRHSSIYASGIFQSQQDIDTKYVLVPFGYAQELFQLDNKVTSIEVGLKKGASPDDAKAKILALIGPGFSVKTQFEQHELFYRTMQSEKWVIFLILGFVLVIASFNILGSLSTLIIDKKDDISILESMGASQKLIRTIFLFEGWMISLSGVVFGMLLGILVCWIQIRFGLLKVSNDGSFIFTAYPVQIRFGDLLAIFALVSGIGFMAAWYPVRFISGKYLKNSGQ